MLTNKDCINSLPVLLSFQPSSPETPTLFRSLNPARLLIFRERERFGAKPSRGAAPPAWGLSPLSKREDHSSRRKDAQSWGMAGLCVVFHRRREQTCMSHSSPVPTFRRCLRVSLGYSTCVFRVNCLLSRCSESYRLKEYYGIFRSISCFTPRGYGST